MLEKPRRVRPRRSRVKIDRLLDDAVHQQDRRARGLDVGDEQPPLHGREVLEPVGRPGTLAATHQQTDRPGHDVGAQPRRLHRVAGQDGRVEQVQGGGGQPAGAPEHRGLRRCRGLVGRYGARPREGRHGVATVRPGRPIHPEGGPDGHHAVWVWGASVKARCARGKDPSDPGQLFARSVVTTAPSRQVPLVPASRVPTTKETHHREKTDHRPRPRRGRSHVRRRRTRRVGPARHHPCRGVARPPGPQAGRGRQARPALGGHRPRRNDAHPLRPHLEGPARRRGRPRRREGEGRSHRGRPLQQRQERGCCHDHADRHEDDRGGEGAAALEGGGGEERG